MIIYPAVDIKDGNCVRLLQGKADQQTIYYDYPVEPARQFKEQGAEWLHVVDLNGAFTGIPSNLDLVMDITKLGLKVQMGGGLRDLDTVRKVLDNGVSRAVVGTRACTDLTFAEQLANEFGDRVAVGIDGNNGKVSIKGWTENTDTGVLDLAKKLEQLGIQTLIHTDIATDGMLQGPNYAAQEALLSAVSINVIASGGVSQKLDVVELKKLAEKYPNMGGIIIGKALYEGKFSLADL